MSIENTPEHPVAIVHGTSAGPARDLHNLLGMIILNGVIARQLNQVVARDALSPVDRERLLQRAQLLRRLLGSQHLNDLPPVAVGMLGKRPVSNDSPLSQLIGTDNQNSPSRHGSSVGGGGGRSEAPRRGRVRGVVRVPGAVADDEAADQRDGEAAEVHGGFQMLMGGRRCGRGDGARSGSVGEEVTGVGGRSAETMLVRRLQETPSDGGGEVSRPVGVGDGSMHWSGGG